MINSKGKGKAPVVLSVKKPFSKKKGQQKSYSKDANGSTSQSKSKEKRGKCRVPPLPQVWALEEELP